MPDKQKSIVPGVVLIIIGGYLLLNQLGVFYFRWRYFYPIAMLALSALFFISIYVKNERRHAFPATALLILGLFFFIRNFNLFDLRNYFYDIGEFWPIFLIAIGAGLIVQSFYRSQNAGAAIPGIILLSIGLIFALKDFYIFDWIRWEVYWPLILIVIGLGLVLSSFRKKRIKAD